MVFLLATHLANLHLEKPFKRLNGHFVSCDDIIEYFPRISLWSLNVNR